MTRLPDPVRTYTGEFARLVERVKSLEQRSAWTGTGMSPQGDDETTVIPGGDLSIDGNANISGVLNVGGEAMFGSDVEIVSGADLLINGGTFTSKSEAGVDLVGIGPQLHGDRGIAIRREDGSIAIEVRKVFGPGDTSQVLIIRDRSGRVIGGDPILSSSGFDAPYIPIPFEQTNLTASMTRAQSTSSATFVPLFEHFGFRQNPALVLKVWGTCSDGSTAGEVQVWDAIAGQYLGGFLGSPAVRTLTIPTGTTTKTLFDMGTVVLPSFMGDDMRLEVHVRRTAGAGSVSVAIARSIGRQV